MTDDAHRPAYDSELAEQVNEWQSTQPAFIAADEIQSARDRDGKADIHDVIGAYDVLADDYQIDVNGTSLTLTEIRPTAASQVSGLIYFIHGGGMIGGDRFTGIEPLMPWVVELNLGVITVEYRLAPEHPHPAPSSDCYAGLVWAAENSQRLRYPTGRLLVAGISAGGGLAAAMALRARDEDGPPLLGQLLMCPMLDETLTTSSAHQFDDDGMWNTRSARTCWQALLGDSYESSDVSPYAAPARAHQLSDLPPAFIDVGSAELFRDEAVEYASRMWADGSQAELHVWPGGFHGFDGFVPEAALSVAAREARDRWVRRLLDHP